MLLGHQDKALGVSLLMQCCNLVPISQLQAKILELIPTAKKAIASEPDSKVKLTCLSLFRKILGQPDLSASYIPDFVPLIIDIVNNFGKHRDFRLEAESL